ncbi:MAG: hypothetical protein RIR01_1421 [Bacteroidota bacterium]|jgi:hypothetical protein
MDNLRIKKCVKLFGRIVFWIFLLSGLCRIFLRDYYSRENHDTVLLVLLALGVVHLILRIIYENESVIDSFKSGLYQIKKYWSEILIIVLMIVFVFFYKRNVV